MSRKQFVEMYECALLGGYELLARCPDGVSERAFADGEVIYDHFGEAIEKLGATDAAYAIAEAQCDGTPTGEGDDLDLVAAIAGPFKWVVEKDGRVAFERPPFAVSYHAHQRRQKEDALELAAATQRRQEKNNKFYQNMPSSGVDGSGCLLMVFGWLGVLAAAVVLAAVVLWAVRYLWSNFAN